MNIRTLLSYLYWCFVFFFTYLIGKAIAVLGANGYEDQWEFWAIGAGFCIWAITFAWCSAIIDYLEYLFSELFLMIIKFFKRSK